LASHALALAYGAVLRQAAFGTLGRNAAANDQVDATFRPLGVDAHGAASLVCGCLALPLLVTTLRGCKTNLQATAWFC
jgi:hypothetical protein